MPEADPKQKQFDVLFTTLGELQQGLISSTTQVAGFLLLTIGWLATSESAWKLLHSHRHVGDVTAAALAGAFGLYSFGAYMVYARSQRTFMLLGRLALMPADCYDTRVINLPELSIFIGGTFFLFGLAAALILSASSSTN